MKMIRFGLWFGFLLSALFWPASASAKEEATPPAGRVTLYSGTGFTGERIELAPGDKIDDFNYQRFPSGKVANNRISSIKVVGDVEVTLFNYRDFKGEQISVRRSVTDLAALPLGDGHDNWNNNLSSITVYAVMRPPQGRPAPDRGDTHEQPRFDDRRPPPPPPPPRPVFDRRGTEKVVRQAYRDVLGREADPEGLSLYIGIMEDRGWSESRLRDQLRSGDEYRQIVVPREVRAAYRDVLGREADPAGLTYYVGRVLKAGWTFTRVRDALKQSPEYKNRPRARR